MKGSLLNARCLISNGDFRAGKTVLDGVIEALRGNGRSRSTAEIFNERGHALYKMVDFPAAKEDFSRAIASDPDFDVPYYNRATVSYRMGDFADAVKDLETAVRLNPGNEEYRTGLDDAKDQLTAKK